MFRDVFHRHGILDRQPVRLGFQTGFVDQNACVGVQPSKRKADVLIDEGDLRRRDACILEFERGALLTAENDDVFAFDADGTGS